MAYNRGERPDAEEKKFVYSAVKKTMKSITRM